jgi:hypothetical protein
LAGAPVETASAAAAKAAADLETAGKSHQARIAELQACFQAKIRDLRRAHDDQLAAAQAAGDHAGHRHAQVRVPRWRDECVFNVESVRVRS